MEALDRSVGEVVPDELLVATPYAQAVQHRLRTLDVLLDQNRAPEDSPTLGLTRLFLTGFGPDAPAELRAQPFEVHNVLEALREFFSSANAGWFPTMGKNRIVADHVIGGGSMSYGGVGNPRTIADAEIFSKLQERWRARESSPGMGVKVGIVDTPIFNAPPLAGGWYSRFQDTLTDQHPKPRSGHATFVAGLILSAAPGATLEIRGVLNKDGKADSWTTAEAIVDLGRSGLDILNLSFTCLTGDGQPPLALATAIDLLDPAVVVVAAAGNHMLPDTDDHGNVIPGPVLIDGKPFANFQRCPAYPAALDNVVAVGSAVGDRKPADYSPTGAWVDVFANGTNVTSTFVSDDEFRGFAEWTGTSFSAALVSGVIAAETIPGEVSARRAWNALHRELQLDRSPGEPPLAPFLDVRRWTTP